MGDTAAPDAQAVSGAEPQAGSSGTPQAGGHSAKVDGTPQAGDHETISLEEARKLRSEAASLRKRLKELEDKTKADEDAKLSEHERLKKQAGEASEKATQLETSLRAERTQNAVLAAAAKLGVNPALAAKLASAATFQFDQDGRPKDVEAWLQGEVKAFPQLAGGGAGDSSPTNPARAGEPTETDAHRRARIYGGGGGGVFDPATARQRGGGVTFAGIEGPKQ